MATRNATIDGDRLPKLCGADCELGNFLVGVERPDGTGPEASRAVLREIDGLPRADPCADAYASRSAVAWSNGSGAWVLQPFGTAAHADGFAARAYDPQDWGRKYLPTSGGCVYIDLNHVEACVPEVISAYDHVAAWHATLRIVRRAQQAANAKLPVGQRIQVLVNNSDGRSNSYGSHVSVLLTRRAWDNIFHRKLHYQLFLAAFQASSIIVTGQGKVGSENGAPPVAYQISQRADFFETLCGQQTTYNRPLVNSRDEPLCGSDQRGTGGARARLHCIFFDNTLCHGATLLKIGLMQLVLAMIEAEQVDPRLLLDDAVDAVRRWSHDPTLQARAAMVTGPAVTALELQLRFLDRAKTFVAAGGCDGIVPRATDIVQLWEDTLHKLQGEDFAALSGRLDWVLKLHILQRALRQHPHLTWRSPEIKMLDHLYSSLDPADGLYWACEANGAVERVASDARIADFEAQPPADTRAWTRAMVLRLADADDIESVDWDRIVFRSGWRGYERTYRRLDLDNPLRFTKAETEDIFRRAPDLDTALDALGMPAAAPRQPATHKTNAYYSGGYLM
jgi:hypothetical protein